MPIYKEKEFNTTHVECCRNCKGTGYVNNVPCPVCDGCGRVVKTVKGTLTVESYKKENEGM